MISKSKIKLIHSLETKKGRGGIGLFVAEGLKVVNDLLHEGLVADKILEDIEDIKKASLLQHPQPVLGVFRMPEEDCKVTNDHLSLFDECIDNQLVLDLDGVQDLGNLGTIIRTVDWFGIENILRSHETADYWNPKIVQATMGSIARVKLHYLNLNELMDHLPINYPTCAALLDGNNIYSQELSHHGMIVMGNERKGISSQLRTKINRKLLTPNYPPGRETTEPLNVAIAASIVCAKFRRQ